MSEDLSIPVWPAAKVFDRLISLMENFAALLIWGLTIAVSVNIFLRRIPGVNLRWLFEVTEYALLVLTFSGGAALLRARGHISVDLAGELVLRARRQRVVLWGDVGSSLIILVMLGVSAKATYDSALAGYVVTGVVAIPRWWIYAVLPVGFSLMLAQSFRNIGATLRSARESTMASLRTPEQDAR